MKRIVWIGGFVLLLVAGLALGVWLGAQRKPATPKVGGRTAEAWQKALRSEDAEEGTRAWQALADLGDEGLSILLEARKDADLRAHRRAALGLVKIGGPAVPGLMQALPRAGDRVEVILVRIGKPALPALQKALREPDRAMQAARVLGGMGERAREAIPALAALLADREAAVDARVEAARALGEIGPEESEVPVIIDPVVASLTAALSGPPKVRVAAARALVACGQQSRPAVAALSKMVKEKDAESGRAASEALGRIGAAESAEALVWRLRRNDDASAASAAALGRLGPAARPAISGLIESLKSDKEDAGRARAVLERMGPAAVGDLEEALTAKNAVTRRAAASVLGLLGARAAQATRTLAVMLKDDDPAVVIAAAAALIRIEPEQTKPVLDALRPLLTHKDEAVASSATAVAGDLGPDAADVLPVFREQLSSKDEKTRRRATGALARARSKDAIAPLLGMLKDPKTRPEAAVWLMRLDEKQADAVMAALLADVEEGGPARKWALAALGQMRPPPDAVVAALLPLLGDPRETSAVCSVLAECRPEVVKPAVPSLIGLLSAREESVREWGYVVLLRAGGEEARKPLESALKSPFPETRAQAARALAATQEGRKDPPSVAAITALLSDEEPAVRYAAARALLRQGARGDDVTRAALPLLGHSSDELRAEAARLCGARPDALAECLLDPSETVREAAAGVPPREGGEAYLVAALGDSSARVRVAAASNLVAGESGEEAAGVILRQARRGGAAERAYAVEELQKRFVSLARGLLPEVEMDARGESLADRLEALRVLILRRPQKSREASMGLLLAVLEGWDAPARRDAAWTLGMLGKDATPAVAALRRRTRRDDSDAVRRACKTALEEIEKK